MFNILSRKPFANRDKQRAVSLFSPCKSAWATIRSMLLLCASRWQQHKTKLINEEHIFVKFLAFNNAYARGILARFGSGAWNLLLHSVSSLRGGSNLCECRAIFTQLCLHSLCVTLRIQNNNNNKNDNNFLHFYHFIIIGIPYALLRHAVIGNDNASDILANKFEKYE